MASSYSTDIKLELMVTGENAGTWGDKTNTNLNLIQQAIAGYESVALTDGGTVALAMTDATLSNARNMVLKFTGTLTTASTVTIPDSIEKFYIFDLSAVTGVTNLTIKTVSGTGFTAGEAKIVAAYSDGTNLNEIALNTLGGTIAGAQIDDASISTAKLSDNAVTTAKISNANVTTAKIADNAVTTAKVLASNITQNKLATDSVGPDQLISTGVSAAEYTAATITVDADGRITAASGGATATPDLIPTKAFPGPSSGTYTATANTNFLGAYIVGGGGPGGSNQPGFSSNGGSGGQGGFGYFAAPLSTPAYSVPYSVAGGGGSTNLSTIGQANSGNGGESGRNAGGFQGAPGNAGTLTTVPGNIATISFDYRQGGNSYQSNVRQVVIHNNAGQGGNPGQPGNQGQPGYLLTYEDLGS